jgi:hypothetical protein
MVASRDFGYFLDEVAADAQKWDGSDSGGLTKWGITAPTTAISVGAPVGGAVTLVSGRNYFVVFKNATTGHHSGLNPVSATTGPITAQDIPLSNIEVSGDSQVDRKIILATADGGNQTILYFLGDIPNAQTTLTDNVTELALLANNVFLETDSFGVEHGVADNDPPPDGTHVIKHRGRLVMANGQFINVSKSIGELTTSTGTITGRYEEAWPATFQLDISEGAESISGLLSNGSSLYVGTERHVRVILGDSPQNFSKPEIKFNEVGVLNQEVWRSVFREGTPAGVIWLAPDHRVVYSDFNTYKDIGTPIQDVLDSINDSQASKAHATFYAEGPYDFYVLAIPTGANTEPETLCVYDLRNQTWYVWQPTDKVTAMLHNINSSGTPQWLWTAGTNGKKYHFRSTDTKDRVADTPVDFTATIRTPWLALSDPTARKLLNELEVLTGDSTMTVTVESASTQAEFASPTTVVSGASLVTSPLGDFKVYLAGKVTKDKFYRFTFISTAVGDPLLNYFALDFTPLHRF